MDVVMVWCGVSDGKKFAIVLDERLIATWSQTNNVCLHQCCSAILHMA